MKALSVTQPWATLIATGAKRIETRNWSTDYFGPLAIHASKGFPGWAKDMCFDEPFVEALGLLAKIDDRPDRSIDGLFHLNKRKSELVSLLPTGAVIAIVRLKYVIPVELVVRCSDFTETERVFGDYSPKRYAWRFDNVQPITPVPAKGALGLWEWSSDGTL